MSAIRKPKPCDFFSYDDSLCPRHGTPSTAPPGQVEEDYIVGQKRPLTWDDFKINVMNSVETRENYRYIWDVSTTMRISSILPIDFLIEESTRRTSKEQSIRGFKSSKS